MMRTYSDKITLIENGRGVYSLDTTIGCYSGTKNDIKGCYGDCYAARSAKRYGYDFTKTVLRKFKCRKHIEEIKKQISKIDLDFIRIGTSGDPSENWNHTISIIDKIKYCGKKIVIITKHFNNLSHEQYDFLKSCNVIFNTSVSALDNDDLLYNSLNEYNRLKKDFHSILRVVTCDFNKENLQGLYFDGLQSNLLKNENIIETVFRPTKGNKFICDGIINVSTSKFLNAKMLVSKRNRKTYTGNCKNCLEQCGLNVGNDKQIYNIYTQLKLF